MKTVDEIDKIVQEKGSYFQVSVDKLTVAGDDAGTFSQTVSDDSFTFIERSSLAPHPYKRQFYCLDGSFLQWTDLEKMKSIRYEFNPNRIKESKEREHSYAIAKILKTMKYPKVNRVDIAIDVYGIDLLQYRIFDSAGRKKNRWEDGFDTLETLYIGSPDSDLRIRIYDKRKQSKEPLPYQWWRIEAQMRDTWCMSLLGEIPVRGNTRMSISPFLMNPFQDLKIHQLPEDAYKQLPDVKERAMVKLLLDDPQELKNLSRPSRAKYKKILASLHTDKEISVSDMFESHKDELFQEIAQFLRHPLANDVLIKSNNKRWDYRDQEEMDYDLEHMNPDLSPDGSDKTFVIESAKMHMMYND